MPEADLLRRCAAEFTGTLFLLATVVGSGIMAESLAGGNVAIALLGNTLPTGAMLVVLIWVFGPVSGAHFNPAVTLAFAARRDINVSAATLYILVQVVGALAGVWLAHGMFDVEILQQSTKLRSGAGQWLSEAVATFGLLMAILATLRYGTKVVAVSVGLYISAAYWFTASTSFANPAVTLGRTMTESFSGIYALHAPAFIAAQVIGAMLAVAFFGWLLRAPSDT